MHLFWTLYRRQGLKGRLEQATSRHPGDVLRAARRKVLLNIFSVCCADINFRLQNTSLYVFSELIDISFETLESQFSQVLQ